MDSLTDDLCAIVLARMPLKTVTASKVVCKQWKSIVESPYFRDLFQSLHQNSHSCSWSLRFHGVEVEIMAHYTCDTWGLERSLDSFISSFKGRFENKETKPQQEATVLAYSDAGLVLILVEAPEEKGSLYVAHPVSQECVEILLDTLPLGFEMSEEMGIVTRTENGVVLGYKVVMMDETGKGTSLDMLVYSSETGSWSLNTFHLPYPCPRYFHNMISLKGSLHWTARNNDVSEEGVVSIDFYATGTGSDRCRVTPFPDKDKNVTRFEKACSTSQGFLMYMNKVTSLEDKLCVWRLQSNGWQLVSEISPAFLSTGVDCYPLAVDPFDAKTAYFWSTKQEGLLSVNLHNGKFVLHKYNLKHIRNEDRVILFVDSRGANAKMISVNFMGFLELASVSLFILPQWLHRIPNTVHKSLDLN